MESLYLRSADDRQGFLELRSYAEKQDTPDPGMVATPMLCDLLVTRVLEIDLYCTREAIL